MNVLDVKQNDIFNSDAMQQEKIKKKSEVLKNIGYICQYHTCLNRCAIEGATLSFVWELQINVETTN